MIDAQILDVNAPDPAALAKSLRDLARDAHRLIHAPRADAAQVRALSRRIDTLREQTRGLVGEPLTTWLDHLGRRLEFSGRPVNTASSPRGPFD